MGQIKRGRVSRHDDYATNELMTLTTGRPSAFSRATSEVMTSTTSRPSAVNRATSVVMTSTTGRPSASSRATSEVMTPTTGRPSAVNRAAISEMMTLVDGRPSAVNRAATNHQHHDTRQARHTQRVSSAAKEGTYATTADMVEKLSVTHVIVSGIRPSFALCRGMATRALPTE